MRSSHVKWFLCHLFTFKSHKSDAVEQHIIRKHKEVSFQRQLSNRFKTGVPGTVTAVYSVRCILCIDKPEFSDRGTLKIHMELHERQFVCHICNRFDSVNCDGTRQHMEQWHKKLRLWRKLMTSLFHPIQQNNLSLSAHVKLKDYQK